MVSPAPLAGPHLVPPSGPRKRGTCERSVAGGAVSHQSLQSGTHGVDICENREMSMQVECAGAGAEEHPPMMDFQEIAK